MKDGVLLGMVWHQLHDHDKQRHIQAFLQKSLMAIGKGEGQVPPRSSP